MPQANTETVWTHLNSIREVKPLVHNITNSVVTNFTANALLATGASPLMAHEPEELKEIINISNSLVINIGTLDTTQVASMGKAIQFANIKSIPVVIDPVGAGASRLRTETALSLIKLAHLCIVKGNGSEVLALAKMGDKQSKGVDSSAESGDAISAGKNLLKNYDNIKVIIISGPTDYVISREQFSTHNNGDPIMSKVTGMGCTLTAITGAFCSNTHNYFKAAQNAVNFTSLCGELAREKSQGPGSFQINFLDQLHSLTSNWSRISI